MADISFDKDINPVAVFGKTFKATVTNAPSTGKDYSKPSAPMSKEERENTATILDGITVASWGDGNNFPTNALADIGKTSTLNSGLRFVHNVVMGQGLFPCKVKGYDNNGNEQLEVVNNPALIRSLNSRMIRRYMSISLRDKLKLGIACPEMVVNAGTGKIVGINSINAKSFRQSIDCKTAFISGMWPDNPTTGNYAKLSILESYDPEFEMSVLKATGKLKQNVIYPLKNDWDNNDLYTVPDWFVAKLAGWVDLANITPSFIIKAYKNQISWVWHVKIPYAFWERKFPKADYKDPVVKQQEIQSYLDNFESKLIGVENANSALFTFFEINQNGKAEEEWKIEALQNKYKKEDDLFTTAVCNSEILFSLLINPSVLGAGMPGGVYSGTGGGSDIREAFLVNLALAWAERQSVTDPIELMYRYNGDIDDDTEIRFRNTLLTTLDTGAGTTKKLS